MTIQLKTEKTEMVISTLGAEPQSLKMEGREYIWSGNPDYWFRRAPLLFPMIGPTPGNRIAYLGREYDMPNNGFARDTEFTLVRQSGNEAVFRLEDSEKTRKENYPFGFVLTVTYTLSETGYTAKAEIEAKDDLYYTFGWHPAFSLDINGEGTELDTYSVSFEENERLDRKYAVDGVFRTERDFLVGDSIELSREETDKGAIILDGVRSSEVTLVSSKGEHGVTATMGDMSTLTIWTCAPKHAQYVCIEPMLSFGDASRPMDISKMKETRLLRKGEKAVYENAFTVF